MADGQHAFQRGDFAGAITHWQQAEHLYAAAQQPQARSVALIHMAYAYAALGHTDRAEDSLRTALTLAEPAGDQAQVALILGQLSDLALTAGNIAEATRLVREALERARALADASLTATLLQTQGNVFMAQRHWSNALEAYRGSARLAQQAAQGGIAARALIHAALAAERAGQPQTATALLADALVLLRQEPPSYDSNAELLLMGQTYHRLAQTKPELALRAAAMFQEAAAHAQTLEDDRTLSYAWGYLGRLYEEERRYDEALDLTRRAVMLAQRVDAPEALYQWQWQTARVLRALEQVQPALEAYSRAVDIVQALHTTLVHGPWDLLSTFRETVGPLYVERADLLLQQAARLEAQPQARGAPQYTESLRQARDTIELLKTAELRDYFGDACVATAHPRVTALEHVAPHTAVVYPILLPDRMELLMSLPASLKPVRVGVPGPQVEQRAQFLRRALEARDPERSRLHAQRLYDWLIRPLEADLAAGAMQTLVFVPDGALRLIPPAVLHDGQQYLIEKYALAVTPSLTLTEPRPLPHDRMHVLAAGLAEAVQGFPALPYVTEELQRLQQLYGGTVLLDAAFSPAQLDQTLRQGTFEIVHIAAHGHFAPQAESSFLLTAQGKLTLPQLAQILGRLRFREHPVELLTLSACETAQGDDRAALGLAGVAIQAGARSAVATLWRVADEASARLMQAFYQQLQKPGVSRAQALQRAQGTLLKDPRYADPFFWAPFLLINNWL
jgi:CHAT domain-containing protein/Tfp pilus assembly protein PilF